MNLSFYLELGIKHILDLNAYDHLLFFVALCAVYQLKDWKRVLLLLTAFTVGHSVTLILAGLDILKLPQNLIETLIPITILICAVGNLLRIKGQKNWYAYPLTLLFGFIHGAGFSNFFNHMLSTNNESIVGPLFAFNLGIEVGQLIIVLGYFTFYYIAYQIFSIKNRHWSLTVNSLIALIAVYMIIVNNA